MYGLYTRKNLDLLKQGRMESVGNDDVSLLNARKCVAGNDDVKGKKCPKEVWVLRCHNNRGYVRVSFMICFLKDFFSFNSSD